MARLLTTVLLVAYPALFFAQPQGYKFPKDSADRNPFARDKVLMHDQELMILTDNITGSLTSNPVHHRIFNLTTLPSLLPGPAYVSSVPNEGKRHMFADVGDFTGDEAQEVVEAWQSGQDIYITIPSIDQTTFTIGATLSSYTLTGPLAPGTGGGNNGRIIVRACDLDGDGRDEFATAYRNANDGHIHIDVFDVDSVTGTITHAGSIADEALYVLNAAAYESFDFVTKDLDYNGVDDLILVGDQDGGTNHNLFCKIYIISGSGSALTVIPKAKSIFDNTIPRNKMVYIKATTGDFNSDLLSEIAVSYNYVLDSYPSPNPDTFIKVLMAADSTATSPLQPDYTEVLLVSPELYTINQNENLQYNFSMDAADIDADGHDEIVVSYDGGASRVLKADDAMHFSLMENIGNGRTNAAAPLYDNYMSVSDMNRDGQYDVVNVTNFIDQSSTPFKQKFGITIHTWDTLSSSFVLLLSSDTLELPINESNGGFERQFTIALGDFDKDRTRFGRPKEFIYSQVKHPLLILNAPPVHFDTLPGGISADVAGVFPCPPVNQDFKAQYSALTSSTFTLETKQNSDWNVSAELSVHDSARYNELCIKGKFGKKFSNTQSSISSVTSSTLNTAYTDDLIYAWVVDYLVREFPIWRDDTLLGYLTSVVPIHTQKAWFGGTDQLGYEVTLNHEPGNLLSYPDYLSVQDDPEAHQAIKADFSNVYSVGPSASFQWGMLFSDINTQTTDSTRSMGIEGYINLGNPWVSFRLTGNYNWENVSTETSTIQSDIKFDIFMGPLAGGVPDANYRVNPYLSWTKNGALALNYSVHPETPSTGFPPTFWSANYNTPDPALVLPWRLAPEKGFPLQNPIKRTLCKSMWFGERNPGQGDTVDIYVRVQNYSVTATNAPVEVSFYLGDPANGGTLMTDTAGQTSVYTHIIPHQGRETLKFTWVTPTGVLPNPRIFAVLDPQNTMTEVHEGNNVGWIPLGLNFPVGIEDEPRNYASCVLYPNPAKDRATLYLELSRPSKIHVELYDITGIKAKDFGEISYPAGEHYLPLQLSGVASGLYICKVSMPTGMLQRKLMVLPPEK